MKYVYKWIAVFFATLLCLGSNALVFACAEEKEENTDYVYYAQAMDGVLTAYSTIELTDNREDIVIEKATGNLNINSIYAFSAEFGDELEGKIYIEYAIDGTSENLRAVKVNGNELQNLDAEFTEEKISFFIDEAGTYAIIDVDNAVKSGLAWYHVLLFIGGAAALALCVVGFLRRNK